MLDGEGALAPGSIKNHIGFVKGLFSFAYKKGYLKLPADPMQKVSYTPPEGNKRDDFTLDERRRMLTPRPLKLIPVGSAVAGRVGVEHSVPSAGLRHAKPEPVTRLMVAMPGYLQLDITDEETRGALKPAGRDHRGRPLSYSEGQ